MEIYKICGYSLTRWCHRTATRTAIDALVRFRHVGAANFSFFLVSLSHVVGTFHAHLCSTKARSKARIPYGFISLGLQQPYAYQETRQQLGAKYLK